MKPRTSLMSRRHFIAVAGATAVTAKVLANSHLSGLPSNFAFTCSHDELRVYATGKGNWTHIQTIPSQAPIALVINPSTDTLHVLHQVAEFEGLPRGYIESFRMERGDGQLRLLSRQPLSLSAIDPSDIALSPDGRALAVAVYGGGAYNLLPILEDGRPGRPIAIRKETGTAGDSPSRPSKIAFSSSSDRIFALDEGTANLCVLSAQLELPVLSRLNLREHGYFSHVCLHPDANLLFLVDSSNGRLLTVRHHPANCNLSPKPRILRGQFQGPLQIHSSSQTLFAATDSFLHAYRMHVDTGELQLIQALPYPKVFDKVYSLVPDCSHDLLYAVTESGIYSSEINRLDGTLTPLARVASPARRIAFL
jgi:6-phosphogluconolactonase